MTAQTDAAVDIGSEMQASIAKKRGNLGMLTSVLMDAASDWTSASDASITIMVVASVQVLRLGLRIDSEALKLCRARSAAAQCKL